MKKFMGRIKASGLGLKKVYDRNGRLIGYVRGRNILDADFNVWALLSSGGATNGKSYVKVKGGEAGYIDYNNNILSIKETYIGTIKEPKKTILHTSIVLLLIAIFWMSVYYSSYVMGNIGLRVYNPNYPVFDLLQQQNNLSWSETEQLNILESSFGSRLLFPGARGSFGFYIDNPNTESLRYAVEFSDINEEAIPMRYRLKKDNVYLAGNENEWLTIGEIDTNKIYIPIYSRSLFFLEWKWVTESDEADTAIGFRATATYNIEITVTAEFFNI